jgi:integrase
MQRHSKWRRLSSDQAQLLLTAAQGERLEALWHVAITTGLRPGEYRALRWSDLDLERGLLRVERALTLDGGSFVEPKTKASSRSIALTASTIRVLREHKRRQAGEKLKAGSEYTDDALVFCTEKGRPLDHNNLVHHHFTNLLKRAGVPRVRLYDLRHTAATLALQAGVPLKMVSHMLGHAGIATTADVYSHVSPEMQEDAAWRVERVLGRRSATRDAAAP